MARILAAKPRILMLDEPFSALDSYLREEVEGEVGSLLAGFAGTVLLVTQPGRGLPPVLGDDRDGQRRGAPGRHDQGGLCRPPHLCSRPPDRLQDILPCTRVGEHTVHLAGWEQPLTVALPVPEGCRAVGIRAHDFAPCAPGTPNSLPVQAVSTSENPFDWNMIFTLPGGEARLWWKVSQGDNGGPAAKSTRLPCCRPENIMPLV